MLSLDAGCCYYPHVSVNSVKYIYLRDKSVAEGVLGHSIGPYVWGHKVKGQGHKCQNHFWSAATVLPELGLPSFNMGLGLVLSVN